MDIISLRKTLIDGKTIYDMSLKVAYYGRVSTDKEEQLNSLENQKNYFEDMIKNNKNWINVGGYIDEGISGTQVEKREKFLKMIEDAKNKKIDLILTKEVSRFARNTIDSIKYTELLLNYGVIVYFISDNINTIYPDSEFRLTIMASMAQDEVRKLSERVKFGIKRSIKDGKLGGSSLYGYHKNNCRLIVNKEEAQIVEKIFNMYISGFTLKEISNMLTKEKIFTRHNNIFSEPTLRKMIKNPRYKGYYTANLTTVEDYKTHKKRINPKEEWIIYKDDRIPIIIDEKIWNKANELLNEKRIKKKSKYTNKIYCSIDNDKYIRSRKNNPVWVCNKYLRKGLKACSNKKVKEKEIDKQVINKLKEIINEKELIKQIYNDYKLPIEVIEEKVNINNNLDKYIDIFINKIIVDKTNTEIIIE